MLSRTVPYVFVSVDKCLPTPIDLSQLAIYNSGMTKLEAEIEAHEELRRELMQPILDEELDKILEYDE